MAAPRVVERRPARRARHILSHNVSMVCGTKEKAHSSFNALKWFYHVWGMSWASNGTPGTRQKCRHYFFTVRTFRNTPRKKGKGWAWWSHDSLGSGLGLSASQVSGLEPALMPRVTIFTHKKREREKSEASEQPEQPERTPPLAVQCAAPNEMESRIADAAQPLSRTSHAQLAQMLWSTDYVGLLLQELLQYKDVAVCATAS